MIDQIDPNQEDDWAWVRGWRKADAVSDESTRRIVESHGGDDEDFEDDSDPPDSPAD